MTVKQWLMRGWKIEEEIASLQRAKAEAYERATSITAQLNGAGVSSSKDPHKFENYAMYEGEILNQIDRLLAVKAEILSAISRVEDVRYRAVLTERFVNLHTLELTAVNLNYSYQHLCRLQGEAFDALRPIIKDEIE